MEAAAAPSGILIATGDDLCGVCRDPVLECRGPSVRGAPSWWGSEGGDGLLLPSERITREGEGR